LAGVLNVVINIIHENMYVVQKCLEIII